MACLTCLLTPQREFHFNFALMSNYLRLLKLFITKRRWIICRPRDRIPCEPQPSGARQTRIRLVTLHGNSGSCDDINGGTIQSVPDIVCTIAGWDGHYTLHTHTHKKRKGTKEMMAPIKEIPAEAKLMCLIPQYYSAWIYENLESNMSRMIFAMAAFHVP